MKRLVPPAVLAGLLVPGPSIAQGLTEEVVLKAMQAPDVSESMDACVEPAIGPLALEMVLVIDDTGRAALSSTAPLVDAPTFSCLAQAVSTASFGATGGTYQITYTVDFEEKAAAPAPPVAAQPVHPGPAPGQASPSDTAWRPVYAQGKAMLIAGIVLSAGGLVVAGGAALLALVMFVSSSSGNWLGLAVAAICGVAVLAVGIPLVIVGVLRKRKASRMKQGLAAGHAPTMHGTAPLLELRF